jgi:hypothetical protein
VPEVICDVSPVQYLHQAGLLDILRLRYGFQVLRFRMDRETRQAVLRLAGEA